MRLLPLLAILFTLFLGSCNNGPKENVPEKEKNISLDQPPAMDGADTTRATFTLTPKFDESKIHGLGIFKIGVPIDNSIGQLINAGSYKFDSVNNEMRHNDIIAKYKKGDNLILKLNPPIKVSAQYERVMVDEYNFVSYDKRAATYTINNYNVDNLKIHDLILLYYDNKLVWLSCTFSNELKKAIQDKFGVSMADAYTNGDIKAGPVSENYEITIKGASDFLQAMSNKAFANQDSIEKNTKPNGGIKNL